MFHLFFVGLLTMLQHLPNKAYTLSVAGQLIHQQVRELQLLPNTRTINGTMLEVSISQEIVMVRSHMVR